MTPVPVRRFQSNFAHNHEIHGQEWKTSVYFSWIHSHSLHFFSGLLRPFQHNTIDSKQGFMLQTEQNPNNAGFINCVSDKLKLT